MGNSNPSRRQARSGVRTPRLEHLLRDELSYLFEAEIGDPCLANLQIERVHLAPNAAMATVYVRPPRSTSATTDDSSSLIVTPLITPQLQPEVGRALERAAAYLRRRLSDVLPMKRSPELRFRPGLPHWADHSPEDEE